MSASPKFKSPSFEHFNLIQKNEKNKKSRLQTNQDLKNLARNSTLILEDDEVDDSNFFDYENEE